MGGGQPLMLLPRDSSTNQRVLFDVSSCGRYVATPHHGCGGTNSIRVFDIVTGQLETTLALPKHAFPNAVALYAACAREIEHGVSVQSGVTSDVVAGTPARPCSLCPRDRGCTFHPSSTVIL